jgi:catechol 2,3-dioxygenase-like lactoylglutathione lyase family enzyme
MNARAIYASLLVADLPAAEDWYSRLLGRGPDHRPMDSLIQWDFFAGAGLMVSTSDEIAGKGAAFVYVEDVATERTRLRELGIALGEDIAGDYSTLAQVHDPDGNLLTLATPPSRPFPPA